MAARRFSFIPVRSLVAVGSHDVAARCNWNISLNIKRLQSSRTDRDGCAAGCEARALPRRGRPEFLSMPLVRPSAFGPMVYSEGQSPNRGRSPLFKRSSRRGIARAAHPAAKP